MTFANIPLSEIIMLVIALLGAGAVTGVLAGVFGVGGGSVIVPVLYELFRVLEVPESLRMPLAVGTSLAIIIPTSIQSFRTHYAAKAVDMDFLKGWAAPVVIGVIAGSFIARYAPAWVFMVVFIIVAGFSSIRMMAGLDLKGKSDARPGAVGMSVTGLIIGASASLMGVGGGLLSNLFMSYCHRPIHRAVATSSGVGVFVSVPGAIGFMIAGWPQAALNPDVPMLQFPISIGFVSLLGVLLFIPTSMATAPFGARLAHRLSKRTLQFSFGLFLFCISLRYLWKLVVG